MYPRPLVLLLVAVGLIVAFAPFPVARAAPGEHIFRVEARQFAYFPSEIRVQPGDRVTIQLVSTDVVHGLYVDGYDLSVEADPGQPAMLTFIAHRPGSFRLRCNITCGAMHPFMIGRLRVGADPWLYRSMALAILSIIGSIPLASTSRKAAVQP